MKRLMIRVSVLVAVVVLGLIAIAQAQRGIKNAPPAAGTTPDAASNAAPRTLPSQVPANPLRPQPSSVFDDGTIPASAVSTDPPPRRAATDSPTDPFRTTPPGVNPMRPRPSVEQMMSSAPAAPAAAPAASTAAKQAPPLLPPLPPASVPLPPSAGSSAAPARPAPLTATPLPTASPLATDPPPVPAASPAVAASDEPAQFKLDPRAPSASLPALPNSSLPAARGGPAVSNGTPSASPAVSGEAAPPSAASGTGKPGGKQLEGVQTPQVTVEKLAPAEIQVGKAATFKIKVRNTGQIPAIGVEIHDEVPKGTRLVSTNPPASQGVRGELVWSLGTMPPGEEMTAEVQLMPVEEGPIGSVATVRFQAEASAQTMATKPELVMEASAPKQVLLGEPLTLSITITNAGTGVATGVTLDERIPAGLQHAAGAELEYEIGSLKPKESRQLQLQLTAAQAGPVTNILTARGEGNLKVEHRTDIQVIAPQLDVAVEGPKRRFLEREATYTFAVSNPGTAPAEKVELLAYLPAGLKFVSANNAGQYDEKSRAVRWLLEELPIQETGSVKVVTMPVEAGEQTLRIAASTGKGLSVEKEHPVVVDGIAAVMFEVTDVNDPVEKGGETTYEIRVVNQGSKAATNVRVVAALPAEMKTVAAEGPTRYSVDGNRVVFEGLSRLAPKADTTYRVRVQCLQTGDLRINVQLLTDEIRTPITKEESTRVYADE